MKSRPVQYLGLVLLVLVSLGVIFLPIGASPEPQPFQVRLQAPKPFSELVAKGKNASDVADAAFAKAFSSNETLPGAFTISDTNPKEATVADQAATQPDAQARAERILKALGTPFKGVTLASDAAQGYANLPTKPLLPLGGSSVYPPHVVNGRPVPAVKLGLDLQGGVNLVLQIRRALIPYTILNAPVTDNGREQLLASVRKALGTTDAGIGLHEADVVLSPQANNQIEIRTQAVDKNQFAQQTKAVDAALKTVADYKFQAGKAQFYEPEASVAQKSGFSSNDYAAQILDQTVSILRQRVDKLGVSEPLIQKQGKDRIVVQLPGVNDPQKAVAVVGQTAQLEICLLPNGITAYKDPKDDTNTLFQGPRGSISPKEVKEQSQVIVSGVDMKPTTTAGFDQGGKPAVFFELNADGARRFGEATRNNIGKQIPIFLDERCITAPVVQSAITDSGSISGGFNTIQEAQQLALLLNSGALPAPIDVVENRTVSATLGQDSLVKSLRAGAIGLLAVAIFMMAFYRLPGVLANCALVIYLVLNLAVFVLVGATLTLPGIAGFLLAMAMSLDTNILVFERLKEEMAVLPNFHAALRAAFSRAWTAILDSHVTTLIASLVLFNFGTGPVKGFALTLGIGVLLSLFSAISVTRLFMWSVANLGEKNRSLFAGKLPAAETVLPHTQKS